MSLFLHRIRFCPQSRSHRRYYGPWQYRWVTYPRIQWLLPAKNHLGHMFHHQTSYRRNSHLVLIDHHASTCLAVSDNPRMGGIGPIPNHPVTHLSVLAYVSTVPFVLSGFDDAVSNLRLFTRVSLFYQCVRSRTSWPLKSSQIARARTSEALRKLMIVTCSLLTDRSRT